MQVTKPYYVHIRQDQGELSLKGFRGPEPALKNLQVFSAGYGAVRDFPENKTMYKTRKALTFSLAAAKDTRIPAKIVPYNETPYYGGFIKI